MGLEQHSYGVVLGGFLTRRTFVKSACAILFMVSLLQITGCCYKLLFVDVASTAPGQCTGTECYDVFSCYGFKDSTQTIREPIALIFGTVVTFMGWVGAAYGKEWSLQNGGSAIICLAVAYLLMGTFDVAYTEICGAYTPNMVHGTLLSPSRLPPSPLGFGTQEKLLNMTIYPQATVDGLTNNFNVLAWYVGVVGTWVAFLLYVGVEARFLSKLVGRGPLGLGVNYGLNQWDEHVNHESIRISKTAQKWQNSQFITDAQLPLPYAVNQEDSRGHGVAADQHSSNYGAANGGRHDPRMSMALPHLSASKRFEGCAQKSDVMVM